MVSGKEISRREAIQVLGISVGSLCLPRKLLDLRETVSVEEPHSYIAQKTWNSCGYAVMAMLISDKENGDVGDVYKEILDYYEMIGKLDRLLDASALVDYMERERRVSAESAVKYGWNADAMRIQLDRNGSTILNVTSNYGTAIPGRNTPNHWIIIDELVNYNGKNYSLIRDPLRSVEKYKPLQELKTYMIPNDDGSIYVPNDNLFPAIAGNYVYLNN